VCAEASAYDEGLVSADVAGLKNKLTLQVLAVFEKRDKVIRFGGTQIDMPGSVCEKASVHRRDRVIHNPRYIFLRRREHCSDRPREKNSFFSREKDALRSTNSHSSRKIRF